MFWFKYSLFFLICFSKWADLLDALLIIWQTGESRKKVVVELKRNIVAAKEAKFQAEVFQFTTDDDMPPYTGFDFVA